MVRVMTMDTVTAEVATAHAVGGRKRIAYTRWSWNELLAWEKRRGEQRSINYTPRPALTIIVKVLSMMKRS